MVPAVIDATTLINLLVTRRAQEVLQCWPVAWHVPLQVQGEITFHNIDDPAVAGKLLKKEWCFTDWLARGLVVSCEPMEEEEFDLLVHYAADRGLDDGEAVSLALARHRKWTLATDDRKALKVAAADGIPTIQTVELIMNWVRLSAPGQLEIREVLRRVETLAHFIPSHRMVHIEWWRTQLG